MLISAASIPPVLCIQSKNFTASLLLQMFIRCWHAGDEMTLPEPAVDSISHYTLLKTNSCLDGNGQLERLVFTNPSGYVKREVALQVMHAVF